MVHLRHEITIPYQFYRRACFDQSKLCRKAHFLPAIEFLEAVGLLFINYWKKPIKLKAQLFSEILEERGFM